MVNFTATCTFNFPFSYSQYDKVVVIGASIMEQVYGRDLVTPNATRTTEWQNNGVAVDVYGYGLRDMILTNHSEVQMQ